MLSMQRTPNAEIEVDVNLTGFYSAICANSDSCLTSNAIYIVPMGTAQPLGTTVESAGDASVNANSYGPARLRRDPQSSDRQRDCAPLPPAQRIEGHRYRLRERRTLQYARNSEDSSARAPKPQAPFRDRDATPIPTRIPNPRPCLRPEPRQPPISGAAWPVAIMSAGLNGVLRHYAVQAARWDDVRQDLDPQGVQQLVAVPEPVPQDHERHDRPLWRQPHRRPPELQALGQRRWHAGLRRQRLQGQWPEPGIEITDPG